MSNSEGHVSKFKQAPRNPEIFFKKLPFSHAAQKQQTTESGAMEVAH